MTVTPSCAQCRPRYCHEGITDSSLLPAFCPLKTDKRLVQEVHKKYKARDIRSFYLSAALTEKQAYDLAAFRKKGRSVPVKPRIREVADFAKHIKARRVGVAFCSGLWEEASRACSILENHGLQIFSVICSCGAADKSDLGIPLTDKIGDPKKFESACNPLLQAELLNRAKTTFNIIIGLCIGHDMLFTQASRAPVTTLVVKDRIAGHNPVITLYSRYYRDIV